MKKFLLLLLTVLAFTFSSEMEQLRELLEEVKKAPPEERYKVMNRVKLLLREMNRREREEAIREIYRELKGERYEREEHEREEMVEEFEEREHAREELHEEIEERMEEKFENYREESMEKEEREELEDREEISEKPEGVGDAPDRGDRDRDRDRED